VLNGAAAVPLGAITNCNMCIGDYTGSGLPYSGLVAEVILVSGYHGPTDPLVTAMTAWLASEYGT